MDELFGKLKRTMKTAKCVKSICILMLLAGGASVGAGEEALRTDINPALLYYQAFLLAPEPMSRADMEYLGTKDGHRWKLPERFGKIVPGYDNQFKLVRVAARSTAPCDWGLDTGEGPNTLLPHMARVKAVAQAAVVRVRWELQHGLQAEARDDLLGTVAMARNVSRGGVLISTLVQIATEAIACDIVAENFGRFSADTLKRLADGFEAAPPRGTVAGCIPAEKTMCLDWLARRIQEMQAANPGDDAKAMKTLGELFDLMVVEPKTGPDANSAQTFSWERLVQAAGGTSQGVLKLIRDLDATAQELKAILTLPYGDFESRANAFKAEVRKSPNPLVPLMVPGWERARGREFRIQVYLAMIRAAVEYKLHGDSGFQAVTDPCGQGPFVLRRFVFQGVDRGFQLTSALNAPDSRSLIFVEKEGEPFHVDGPRVGQAFE